VPGIDDTWQIDLADNGKIKYILVCIDVFSKFLSMEPTEDKTGKAVVKALNAIFERTEKMPKQIQSDDGTEFYRNFLQIT
jgi:IS30 family transposase